MSAPVRCRHTIEGPNGSGSKSRHRPWWRRNCKRLTTDESGLCWQHR